VAKQSGVDRKVLHRRAQIAMLSGLARGDAVYDVVEALAPNRVRHDSAPDVALLELAVTALDLACPPGAEPLEYEGLREQYLPEVRFRGRVEHRNSQYALYAAAGMRGGLKPDLLSDAGRWQTRCGSTRSTPSSSTAGQQKNAQGVPREQIARLIAARHHLGLANDGGPHWPAR
jgi:hypothetical protein